MISPLNIHGKTKHISLTAKSKQSGLLYGVVDCNSFYCSAERVFRPELAEKPVVVLSNNDGCIISRSDEAKAYGLEMTGPYFKAKPAIEKYGVATFSSNYNLYGDMSWRVMETLRCLVGEENVEVYSVDEAFINLTEFKHQNLEELALRIRFTVEQWTGVKVSVGIAPTKTLSKTANHIAKQDKKRSQCVSVLDTKQKLKEALCATPVKEIWGVGKQYADKLKSFGIHDADILSQMPEEWARKNLGGVVGVRLVKELKGEQAIGLDEELTDKKMIATTRMFGSPVTGIKEIKEAIATYTSRAAEKLRRQYSAATCISIFIVHKQEPKPGESFRHGPTVSNAYSLPHPTCVTSELIKPALQLVNTIYKKGLLYKKAGVMLSGLVPDVSLQANLFEAPANNNNRMLMSMMDNINFSMRNDILKFAASGTERNWKMRQELRSPRYTSRWSELRGVT